MASLISSLISVEGLGFQPPGRNDWVLKDAHLTLAPGEIVLVAGPTGSGKSTLINAIAGIVPLHTGGRLVGGVFYEGIPLAGLGVRERARRIGTVLQNIELQMFTDVVCEEVAFGLENLNVPRHEIERRIGETLAAFGLAAQRDWPLHRLSAGQKQRLVLGCVLAMGQRALLLDEPFAYLDRAGSALLVELLVERARQGQGIVVVEHRLDLVAPIAHRLYHCSDGTLAEGPPPLPAVPVTHQNAPAPGAPVLVARGLSWGGYPAFADLEVSAGETVLLKGDNGSGKTTLLRLVSGLLKPTTGAVRVGDRDLTGLDAARRAAEIGFVLQNPNHQLFADSVEGELAQPGVPADLARALLERLTLVPQRSQHPQSLSQGQKRRLALGAVLARRPKVLLLDEITVGQDPGSLALMLAVLRDFTAGGGALVLTSHDPQAAAALGARVVEVRR
jgi:energy-coupling factor transport system ATP-binding protein